VPSPTSTEADRSTDQRSADSRLRRPQLRRPTLADLLAAVLFAIAGIMFVAGSSTSGGGDLRVDQTGGLRAAISALSERNLTLRSDVSALAGQVEQLRAEVGAASDVGVTDLIAELAPMAGLTEVRGPGVTVTLDDARPPDPIPDGMTGDDYIVHQQDVQGVVNALWRGGASGITVMGQRLANTSAVRCVGNTVILHGRVYSPPFVIAGVGHVSRMVASLDGDDAVSFFREWAGEVGMHYEQVISPRLTLPAYTGPVTPQHARVIEQ
jgi:uncharacterized protein YlxW (UPF0749 family)